MKSSIVAAALLPFAANAAIVTPRAGGPVAKPIPSNCTVINPIPHAHCGTANVAGYQPSPAFVKSALLWQSYFDSITTPAAEAKTCKQQCYGYGVPGDCKSSFLANNVPVPKGYFGSPGGELKTGCLLFKYYLSPLLFTKVTKAGTYVNATAADIYCPAS